MLEFHSGRCPMTMLPGGGGGGARCVEAGAVRGGGGGRCCGTETPPLAFDGRLRTTRPPADAGRRFAGSRYGEREPVSILKGSRLGSDNQ